MPVVIRWNPAQNIFTLDDVISQMLEWTSDLMRIQKTEKSSAWVPAADMYETEEAVIIHMELAGIERNSLEILFQDEFLFLRGERPFSDQMRSAKIHRIERMYGHFQRVFQIPQPIDVQHVSASYEQGVLKIVLMKQKHSLTERVKIPITV